MGLNTFSAGTRLHCGGRLQEKSLLVTFEVFFEESDVSISGKNQHNY